MVVVAAFALILAQETQAESPWLDDKNLGEPLDSGCLKQGNTGQRFTQASLDLGE